MPKPLDAETLVCGIIACKVAIGLEPDRGVSTSEEKLLVVAHCGGDETTAGVVESKRSDGRWDLNI